MIQGTNLWAFVQWYFLGFVLYIFCIVDVLIIMFQHDETSVKVQCASKSQLKQFPLNFMIIKYDRKFKHNSSKENHLAFVF